MPNSLELQPPGLPPDLRGGSVREAVELELASVLVHRESVSLTTRCLGVVLLQLLDALHRNIKRAAARENE
jgi:hypothetical protein